MFGRWGYSGGGLYSTELRRIEASSAFQIKPEAKRPVGPSSGTKSSRAISLFRIIRVIRVAPEWILISRKDIVNVRF